MRLITTTAAVGCALLALAGCKQETTVPAADATTTVIPGPTSTSTAVVGVPVPGPTVTETAAPPPTERPTPN